MDYEALRRELTRDEGRKKRPYRCTAGKLTIGVGWNLEDQDLPERIIDDLLDVAIARAESEALVCFPSLHDLTEARQRVLVNLAFNLGSRLRKFVDLREAVAQEDYRKAAAEMRDSTWYRQVGQRAERLAVMMERG